jgi:hypothetical protein
MHGAVFFMKADYDAVSAERRALPDCRVTGSRPFAAKLLFIFIRQSTANAGHSGSEESWDTNSR